MNVTNGLIHNQCPVDLHALPDVKVTTAEELKAAILNARAGQAEWEQLGFDARAKALTLAAKQILSRRQEVLELLHDETGKTPGDVLMGEALGALQFVQDWIKVARPHLKPRTLPMSPIAFPGKSGVIELLPRGLVAVIAPWNFPLANFFKPVFAALLCGNAVLLKPSELSPRMGAWFTKVLGAYLPAGVLTVIQGGRETGTALVRAGVDAVTFTGSTASGRDVAKLCGELLIPVSLELGGKDAAVVLNDCNLDRTVAGVMYWSLANAGQACGAIERVFVEEGIADHFIETLSTAVARLRVTAEARTSDVGPLANARQLEIVEAQVKEAVEQGAKVKCGGARTGDGLWFEPTVLDHCTPSMKVMREPTFGPVIALCRVANADTAVTRVNDCDYGLNASVWSMDIERAKGIARRLEVGTAYVNNHGFTGAMPAAPWTGVKQSGAGVANSVFALNHYTRPRSIVVDKNTGADAWWFPMDAALEELGHRLSEAQLGNVLAAAKVPLLLAQRQRAVLKFVRKGARMESVTRVAAKGKSGLARMLSALGKKLEPALTDTERHWGAAAMEAVFTDDASKSRFHPVSNETAEGFIDDALAHMPFTGRLGMRAAIATLGLAVPSVLARKLTSLDKMTVEERLKVLEAVTKSDIYLLRQMTLLMKTTGALTHASTTRFQQALNETQKSTERAPTFRS